jgi:hypothetical protein
MPARAGARPPWRFGYACGHTVLFSAPRTPDELPHLSRWLGQVWGMPCGWCGRPRRDESAAARLRQAAAAWLARRGQGQPTQAGDGRA